MLERIMKNICMQSVNETVCNRTVFALCIITDNPAKQFFFYYVRGFSLQINVVKLLQIAKAMEITMCPNLLRGH